MILLRPTRITSLTRISGIVFFLLFSGFGCNVYRFNQVSIPPNVKTVRVNFIENKARYVNPLLSPRLTERLRQKIVSQTRLTEVKSENADYDITGFISSYEVSTSGISNQKTSSNQLTVGVNIKLLDRLSDKPPRDISVSRSFEFSAGLTLQQAEAKLNDEMIRNLTDEIFNRLFSDW